MAEPAAPLTKSSPTAGGVKRRDGGMRRPVLYPGAWSPFSHWYWANIPADRGHADIDGLVFRRRRLEGLLEHRTNGYVGGPEDNRAVPALRHLAWVLGLAWTVTPRLPEPAGPTWGDGSLDTRHVLWVDYVYGVEGTDPRILAVYDTPGNVSPADGHPVLFPAEVRILLAAHCEAFEVPYRTIDVSPDTGAPKSAEDVRWLVELRRRTVAR